MEINPKIFKAYDIRGIYPSELNEQSAYSIGRAFAKKANAKQITVGSDMRLSGPALKKALIDGITDEGADVKDIGLVPIDAVYDCVGKFGDEAGIMITASHNPKEYNGFKMVLKGMQWIRGTDLKDEVFSLPEKPYAEKGKVFEEDIMPKFVSHVLSFADVSKIKPFKVVVDAGNGMAGKVIPLLEKHLPLQIVPLNFTLDGNFPAHPSNPLEPESQKQICEAVVKEKAHFGVIFDGDTDRVFFVDENGNFLVSDYVVPLLAKVFLEREPGSGIVFNLTASKVVPESILEMGGTPLESKIGYVNMSSVMREEGAIMGGEISSHYSFRDNAFADSGFIAFLVFAEMLSESNRPVSEIVKPYQKYAKASDINFTVADKEKVLEAIKEKYSNGKQSFLDGVKVQYADWWFNVRGSNTEPLLRLMIEADTPALLSEKQKELSDLILSQAHF